MRNSTNTPWLRKRVRGLSQLALAIAIAPMALAAQANPVYLECSLHDGICFMDATSAPNPKPFTVAWQNVFPVTFSSYCPTTSTHGWSGCGIRCVSEGTGSITVTVLDANGQLVGSATADYLNCPNPYDPPPGWPHLPL